MFRFLYSLSVISIVADRVFYLDHFIVDNNPALLNATIAYTHNEEGVALVNITVQTFKTVTKLLVSISEGSCPRKRRRSGV